MSDLVERLRGVFPANEYHQNAYTIPVYRITPNTAEIHWTDYAYMRLGFIRDKMNPEHVVIIQDFLEAAKKESKDE